MPRPRCCRRVSGAPACKSFRPMGVPVAELEEVTLALDEYEAIRLADHEGLYQEQAAERMGVSRQTFGRTLEAARGKVARALVLGLLLNIETQQDDQPGAFGPCAFACQGCGHTWEDPLATGRPLCCPGCKGTNFRNAGCAATPRRAAAKPSNTP